MVNPNSCCNTFRGAEAPNVFMPTTAPVRTLRSVNAPAVAIELGRLAPDADATALTNPAFQQQVANAVVQALAGSEKSRVGTFRGGANRSERTRPVTSAQDRPPKPLPRDSARRGPLPGK